MDPVMRVQGYAALYGVADRAGDVFLLGAFAGALPVPLLMQHHGPAVGDILAIGEDPRGLWIEAAVHDPTAAALVRQGALRGLSVGYRAIETRQGARRMITRAALAEVSLVRVPMQPGARIDAVIEAAPGAG